MKRSFILGIGLSGLLGITGILSFVCPNPVIAGEGHVSTHDQPSGKHAKLNMPIRTFTKEMEKSVNNLLNGILEGNFDIIKQEAGNIETKSKGIYISFFKNANRFRLMEKNPEREEQKKDFAKYVADINKRVDALKKAADSQDTAQALTATVGLLKEGCISCHTKYRK